MTIAERVQELIVEIMGADEDEVKLSSSFIDDLGFDSLDQVELLMAVEDEFEIVVPDEDIEKIRTVQEAVDFIVKHVPGQIRRKFAAVP